MEMPLERDKGKIVIRKYLFKRTVFAVQNVMNTHVVSNSSANSGAFEKFGKLESSSIFTYARPNFFC